jgi:hypothetical protein
MRVDTAPFRRKGDALNAIALAKSLPIDWTEDLPGLQVQVRELTTGQGQILDQVRGC